MRIWVARPEPGAARSAARLRALGHAPLVAPVMETARTGQPAPEGRFDAAILTSANAALPLAELAGIRDLPIFSVGGRTAEAAAAAGFSRVIDADGDGADLAARIAQALPAGARLLHAAGTDIKAEPGRSLQAGGYALTIWQVYTVLPVARLPEAVAAALIEGAAEPLEAVLHYSRRSAAFAAALAREAGHAHAFRRLAHYCLSADVAVPLVESGVPAHFVAAYPNEDALLDRLPRATGDGPASGGT